MALLIIYTAMVITGIITCACYIRHAPTDIELWGLPLDDDDNFVNIIIPENEI